MTELDILKAVNERDRKDGETIRQIMTELGIPINLKNAQITYAANTMFGAAVYMALPNSRSA